MGEPREPLGRRSFIKGLLGVAGATVAGSYVIHNPTVLAGDILVPSPDPAIIKANVMPDRIHGAGDAIVTNISISSIWNDLTRMEIILQAWGDNNLPLHIRAGDEVRLYVVKKGDS